MSGTGFGDSLSVEEMIAMKQPLLNIMARERGVQDCDMDDVVQEASIALWEVAQARPDAPSAYLHGAARLRMTEYITRGKATGQPSQQGKQKVVAESYDADPALVAFASEILGEVEIAYHSGEIMRAVAALTPQQRRYVVLRFWSGLDSTEISARMEVSADSLTRMWRTYCVPSLRESLGHLAGMVSS